MVLRRRMSLPAAALAAVLAGFVAPVAPTAAEQPREDQQKVQPAFESWYQADPTCETPVGCLGSTLPVPPPTIYPARMLHVGTLGGQEIARTYLAFYLDDPTAQLTSARLSIPLDTDPASGGQLPEQSRVEACVYTGSFTAVDGSLDTPPEADCENGVILTYQAEPQPRLVGDLKPLLAVLPTSSGIALVPAAPDATDPTTGAWRVVFSASDRPDAPTGPASLKLTVKAAPSTDEPASSPPSPAPASSGGGKGSTGPAPSTGGGGDVVTAPVEAPAPVKAGGQLAAPTGDAAPVVEPVTEFVGYAYPLTWTVPLLIAALLLVAGRELTRDLGARR